MKRKKQKSSIKRKTKKDKSYILIILFLSISITAFLFFRLELFNYFNNFKIININSSRLSAQQYPIWGLDLSHHNGEVNWKKIAKTEPNFVFIKATEGFTFQDKKFIQNWDSLKKLNIKRGAYHFFSYKSNGKEQAENYIELVKLENGDLPPVLDAEYLPKMPNKKKVTKELLVWLEIIEKHYKVKPIIYCPLNYYKQYLEGEVKNNPLWICDYNSKPIYKWTFWQHSCSFLVPGIKSSFDRNVFNGDSEKLNNLLINYKI